MTSQVQLCRTTRKLRLVHLMKRSLQDIPGIHLCLSPRRNPNHTLCVWERECKGGEVGRAQHKITNIGYRVWVSRHSRQQ